MTTVGGRQCEVASRESITFTGTPRPLILGGRHDCLTTLCMLRAEDERVL